MACLGEASRFRLVQVLMGGARCVTDLASEVGLSQSCTTRHLQALESRRVVAGRRDGKRVLYRIRDDDPGLLPLLRWALDQPVAETPRPARARAADRRAHPVSRAVGSDHGTRAPVGGGRTRPAERRPVGPASRPPDPEPPPEPGSAEAPIEPVSAPVRRGGSSEIEDYLL